MDSIRFCPFAVLFVTSRDCLKRFRLKHLLRYVSGTHATVLGLRPIQMLGDWRCTVDVTCYVDSDWAGCHKTRVQHCLVQVLDCSVIRIQATVALSSGEAELHAIGQGIDEAFFEKHHIGS